MPRRAVLGVVALARAGFGRSVALAAGSIPAPPDVAKPPPEAIVESSGLASLVLKAGSGSGRPGPTDKVTVDCTLSLPCTWLQASTYGGAADSRDGVRATLAAGGPAGASGLGQGHVPA